MMRRKKIFVAAALVLFAASGASYGVDLSKETSPMKSEMNNMMKGEPKLAKQLAESPEYAAAMAYRASLNAYATALQTMAKAGKVPAATARELVADIKASTEGVRKNLQAAVEGLPSDLKSSGEKMRNLVNKQVDMLGGNITSLEKTVQSETPEPKSIMKDTKEILGNGLGFVENALGKTKGAIEKAL